MTTEQRTGKVRTVLGDIDATSLGAVDCHDHLVINGGPGTVRTPDLLLDDVDDAVREAEAFGAAGGGTIVDMMPPGAGRSVPALVEISQRAASTSSRSAVSTSRNTTTGCIGRAAATRKRW